MYKEIQGIFNGQNMAGNDGQIYLVPPNYASKSKLVEGDTLKASIQEDGSIIYKQIQTVRRIRFIGTVTKDNTIEHDGAVYSVLDAIIRFYHLRLGMQVSALTAQGSTWCAVENVISATNEDIEM